MHPARRVADARLHHHARAHFWLVDAQLSSSRLAKDAVAGEHVLYQEQSGQVYRRNRGRTSCNVAGLRGDSNRDRTAQPVNMANIDDSSEADKVSIAYAGFAASRIRVCPS